MPLPSITFNATTGSDTAASGAGPASAVTGPAAAHTGGVASTTITLVNSPDLSGVAVDGSAVLWLQTASGRQFSKITAVDNVARTVTAEDVFTIASASAVAYAIGGTRATIGHADSKKVFLDAKPGWTITTETDQSYATAMNLSASGDPAIGPIVFRGSGATRTLSQGNNAPGVNVTGSSWVFRSLRFVNTSATKTAASGIKLSAQLTVRDCTLGDPTSRLNLGVEHNSGVLTLVNCEVRDCLSHGISSSAATTILIRSCFIHANGGAGISATANSDLDLRDNIIAANTGTGIVKSGGTGVNLHQIIGNTVHGNGGDGLDISTATADALGLVVINNNFTGNGGYGFRGQAAIDAMADDVGYNNYGTGTTANTLGASIAFTAGPGSLAVDPAYVNASGGNFAVGTALGGVGSPDGLIGNGGTITRSYVDIGAAQRQEPAGASAAGGGTVIGSSIIRPARGGADMAYRPGDPYYGEFTTSRFDTGAAASADTPPTVTATRNGVDDPLFTLSVVLLDVGRYRVSGTIPASYAAGDAVQVSVAATVAGVAAKGVVDGFILDRFRLADVADASGAVRVQSGTGNGQISLAAGAVTVGTNGDKGGYVLASSQSFSTTGSVGAVAGDLAGSVGALGGVALSGVRDAVWGASQTAYLTPGTTGESLATAATAPDPWATDLAGYAVGTAGGILRQNLDATVSSRSVHAAADVWAVPARSLTDRTGVTLAPDGLDAVGIEVGVNARQAVSAILASSVGVLTGGATDTITIRGGNVGATRVVATVDADGNRTSVLLSLPF